MTEEQLDLSPIEARFPPGAWFGISTPRDWDQVLLWADEALAAIDPDYKVSQIKEKFGGLRYYFQVSAGVTAEQHEAMRCIERLAEYACEAIDMRGLDDD